MSRPLALLGSTALAAFAIGALGAAPASAAPIAACTAKAGNIIAVDFSHWGGAVTRGCVAGSSSNGVALLTAAGFGTTNVQGQPFVCRIGNAAFHGGRQYPTTDPCTHTPPASAYWSYWTAGSGTNRWSYTQLGAYSHRPTPGEVDLWTFGRTSLSGGGNPTDGYPTISPNALRPKVAAPHSTAPARPGPTHRQSTSPARTSAAHRPAAAPAGRLIAGSARAGATSTSTAATTAGSAARARAGEKSPGAGAAVTATSASVPTGSSATTRIVDAQPASKGSASAGSALPLIVGTAILAVLAAGGGLTVWRRRRGTD